MPSLRVMTFNVENLLARFNFRAFERDSLVSLLDAETEIDRPNLVRTHWNVLNNENRVFTALAIRDAAPDVACLQEVDTLRTLKKFHHGYLRKYGELNYRHRHLVDGNDPRGIDVAVMSRFKIDYATSYQDVRRYGDRPATRGRERQPPGLPSRLPRSGD